jgi:hypothetical protein
MIFDGYNMNLSQKEKGFNSMLSGFEKIVEERILKAQKKGEFDNLPGMKETYEKYRILNKLNFLIMKLNSIRNTSIQLEMPQLYTEKLVERFGSSHSNTKD